jgi:hypothetical protein
MNGSGPSSSASTPQVRAVRQTDGGAFEAGLAVEPAVAADVTLMVDQFASTNGLRTPALIRVSELAAFASTPSGSATTTL